MNRIEELEAEVARLKAVLAAKDDLISRLKQWNKWFVGRVKYMRTCQEEYFRTRQGLSRSKAVEREVDGEIKRIEDGVALREKAMQMTIEGF